ncbi:MAG: polymer-forming cytoskeletal protein [Gammaproteobacteria bacterium]|nr:polymer-forming cytoskeletal protein [Gammaproteobacteria bacterium]MDH5694001.1 polymer-forming cytoskeletal protein [Gammaproteobacteria bacterium]
MMGKKRRTARIDSLIGQNTEIKGDLIFTGGLHIDGKVKGNVIGETAGSLLTLSDQGVIEGEVRVPCIILNGTVIGDVHASERIELATRARVSGNVFYNLIEMAIGAEVNGKLVHRPETEKPKLTHMKEKNEETVNSNLGGTVRVGNS